MYVCHRLLIDCLLISLDAHMFSHDGYGPGIKDQGLGPEPISTMAEHMCVKGNQ